MINLEPEHKFSSTQVNIESPLKEEIQSFIKEFIDLNDLNEDGIEDESYYANN